MRVAGLVLAAGAGRRFGAPKATVELAGERLVDRAVRVLREGGCEPLYVVAGAVALDVPGATVVDNPNWDSGMGSSLGAGLAAMSDDADAVVISLVDQPGIGPEVVRRLIARAMDGAEVVVATYDGRRRNPVLLGSSTWMQAARVAVGDVGARAFLDARTDLVTAVECSDVADARDVDLPRDLAALHRGPGVLPREGDDTGVAEPGLLSDQADVAE